MTKTTNYILLNHVINLLNAAIFQCVYFLTLKDKLSSHTKRQTIGAYHVLESVKDRNELGPSIFININK